mmetsp:Transcript_40796/g.57353  ORF Transcript_40796/g.57353 Transcript_40796/m.57353 type:complete len:254 (-) Transcript_40796:1134-1895(-)
MHFPNHGEQVMVHCKSHITVDIAQTFDAFLRHVQISAINIAVAEVFQRWSSHPLHLLLCDSREAALCSFHFSYSCSKRSRCRQVRFVTEMFDVTRIIRSCKCLLQSHNWIARLLSRHVANLSKHQVLNVSPFHTKVNDIALHIHTTTASTTLHLLRNKWSQSFTHITTENTTTERHIHTVCKGSIRKYNSEAAFLSKHLYLTTVARKPNFIGIDCNSSTESSNQGMINVYLLSRFFHVSDDVLNLIVTQTFSC